MKSKWKDLADCTMVMGGPGGLLYRVSTLDDCSEGGSVGLASSEALMFVPCSAKQVTETLEGLPAAYS